MSKYSIDFRHRVVMDCGDYSKIIYGMRESDAPSSDWRTLPTPFAELGRGGKRPVPGGEMRERPVAFFSARIHDIQDSGDAVRLRAQDGESRQRSPEETETD